MDICSTAYETSIGSPQRSTFGETCFSFDAPSPASDEIFESKLHQLLQTLNSVESYSHYNFHQAIIPDQQMRFATYQQIYPVITVQNVSSSHLFGVEHASPVLEVIQEQLESSRVTVPFEVSN